MTKVEIVEKDISNLEAEVDKLEDRISWIEFEMSELQSEEDTAHDTIASNREKLKKLYEKLKVVKEDNEPLDGQLAFVNTGYKTVVEI
ncbi:MAG TPA: hypothetical protein GX707_10365 [Epulopiscium sp.]|nr:hypothetical protein [Candidatus Epulonipiscium sp.]